MEEKWYEGGCGGTWTDENGQVVVSKSFFGRLYEDEKSRKLDEVYDIRTAPIEMVPSSLGQTGLEILARDLLDICRINGCVVGFEEADLMNYSKWNAKVLLKYLRLKKVEGTRVLFPTEKLLENQGVKKREKKK